MFKSISFIIFVLHTIVFSNCPNGLTEIDGNCYSSNDLLVLEDFIYNSDLDMSPIDLGVQEWTDGRLSYLCVSEFEIHGCQTEYQLSGEIPESIGTLIGLEDLRLLGNNLSGQIPESIGNLINLKYLDLNYNQLSGNIPVTIGDLLEITEMYISYNEVSEEIPESICNLVNLKYLYLGSNFLNGNLPECLGNLDIIEVLILDGNEFTGFIPSSIGTMDNLSYLNISNNQLIGGIPESIGELVNLNFIYLNGNILTDQIPSNICNLDINWTNPIVSSIADNFFCLQPFPNCIEEFIGTQSCGWNVSGDSNLNEEVDILDIIILLEFVLDIKSPDQFQFIVSDIDPNNRLDVLDLVYLIDIVLQ